MKKISFGETALWIGNYALVAALAYYLLEPLSAASASSPIDFSSNAAAIGLMMRFAVPAILVAGLLVATLWRMLKS